MGAADISRPEPQLRLSSSIATLLMKAEIAVVGTGHHDKLNHGDRARLWSALGRLWPLQRGPGVLKVGLSQRRCCGERWPAGVHQLEAARGLEEGRRKSQWTGAGLLTNPSQQVPFCQGGHWGAVELWLWSPKSDFQSQLSLTQLCVFC